MTSLIIVGDHPSLHRGFATVGDHVATGLQESGRWAVDYVGFYPPAPVAVPRPYRVFDVESSEQPPDVTASRLRELMRELIADVSRPDARRALISIGADHGLVLGALEAARVRERVDVIAYVAVDTAPLPPSLAGVLRRVDVLVPYTAFGARALRHLLGSERSPDIATPIAHGVDTAMFSPPSPTARAVARRRLFGIEDDRTPVIGFFGRNSAHKHPERALEIFATYARGAFVECRPCLHVMTLGLDPFDQPTEPPRICSRCGSTHVQRGSADTAARLYMHTDLLTRAERVWSGGWDLPRLATQFGISAQVIFNPGIRTGEGVDIAELAARMGACDVHLLPSDSGGWELTVLETAACGVANIITDTAAPPEYAAPFARLIPPAVREFRSDGARGIIDVGRAVAALKGLVQSPSERRRLGECGVEVARAHTWPRIVQAWSDLLERRAQAAR